MKLCSGKRRHSRSRGPEVPAGAGRADRSVASERSACGGERPAAAALLWPFTRRTAASRGPRRRVKFASGPRARPSPGLSWLRARRVAKRARIFCEPRLRPRPPASLSRVGRRCLRPVLKHGPRSLTCARVTGRTKPKGAVKAKAARQPRDDPSASVEGAVPALPVDLASWGAARARTLGPERW